MGTLVFLLLRLTRGVTRGDWLRLVAWRDNNETIVCLHPYGLDLNSLVNLHAEKEPRVRPLW